MQISVPYLDVGDLGWSLMRLGNEEYDRRRHDLVDRVFANCDVDTELCPDAWRTSPLQRWCWLLLHVNGLELDDTTPAPLIHWGIDMGLASSDVRAFVWAVS